MTRRRIGVDLRALVPESTGIGVATSATLRRLVARGRYDYVGLSHAPIAAEKLAEAGVECEVEPAPLGVLWQQLRLPRRLRRGGIDLLWSPILTLPWRLPGPPPGLTTPGVVTVHDLTPLRYPEMHRAKVRWSIRPFLRRTLSVASAVVASSEATRADIGARFPGTEVDVVPLGVSSRYRPGTPDEVDAVRARLGLHDGYLLHVGTFEPRKNVARLVDAWLACRELDSATLPLVLAGGAGWRTEELAARIAGLSERGVRSLGRVPDDELPALYRGATGFLFPSFHEGFGLPPLEAMASGVPVAVSNRSSLPEVVGDAGPTFDPEDLDAIAAAITDLATLQGDARKRRIDAGLARAARFTWDRSAERMESIFDRVLSVQSPANPTAGRGPDDSPHR